MKDAWKLHLHEHDEALSFSLRLEKIKLSFGYYTSNDRRFRVKLRTQQLGVCGVPLEIASFLVSR